MDVLNHPRPALRPTVLSLLLLGCAPRPAELPLLPAVVEVTAHDYAFVAPDTVAAGEITFRLTNAGPDFHHLVIIPLPDGKRATDLVSDTTFLPTWAPMLGGPNVVQTGNSTEARVTLQPGRYAMFCLIPNATDRRQHKRQGMVKEFVAVPARVEAAPAVAPTTTVILNDYDFEFSAPLAAGPAVILVENRGPQPHEVEFVRIADGVTVEEAFKWRRTDSLPAPYTILGGLSPLSTGERGVAYLDFTPGRYVVVCYVPDSGDGRPHVAHGMRQEFTIE